MSTFAEELEEWVGGVLFDLFELGFGGGGRRGWDCDAGRVGLGTGAWARREEEENVRVAGADAVEGARKDCESRLNMVLVLDAMLFNVCPKVAWDWIYGSKIGDE